LIKRECLSIKINFFQLSKHPL